MKTPTKGTIYTILYFVIGYFVAGLFGKVLGGNEPLISYIIFWLCWPLFAAILIMSALFGSFSEVTGAIIDFLFGWFG